MFKPPGLAANDGCNEEAKQMIMTRPQPGQAETCSAQVTGLEFLPDMTWCSGGAACLVTTSLCTHCLHRRQYTLVVISIIHILKWWFPIARLQMKLGVKSHKNISIFTLWRWFTPVGGWWHWYVVARDWSGTCASGGQGYLAPVGHWQSTTSVRVHHRLTLLHTASHRYIGETLSHVSLY